ncbi:precorrin-6y C5,15-methyltransferase (decarboxylating) subunit CbiE [Sphingomonas sp. CFBP 13728]|uniref:precorrin-6y C5,15-methyltransferase (decarboxylating) subunit CbiE n=1 Tax=Sphingomonas sp. CFBP 13728 TaxID=2775294 RepID=UPI00177AE6D7|nr:precorrin-6y C5,15-methyltransferase (decarboxylating) subunit CbiE [Sphingomonas sp. CFBP 13728]MBD8617505.1 precorrin-6y C5,15-methyltransferase (decarboxylating) subunit CbiE [Sphingomonas sp. CFBP 13728]
MAEAPWLTIVGIGEDGIAGLSAPARLALAEAEVVTGATRHLALVGDLTAEVEPWPVPFDQGIAQLLTHRGRHVVMLVSGDPFWFGAGTSITRHLPADEWIAYPVSSTFSLAAARLGWPLEDTPCLGLHATPFSRLRPHIAVDRKALVLVRDGDAVAVLARYLCAFGFGGSRLHILEALGGPRERIRHAVAADPDFADIAHPVAIGITFAGAGNVLPQATGLPDAWFEHDGQITKSPIRALTLSALAPKPGEKLWDVGAGSGSISIEWLLSHPSTHAIAFEADPIRAGRARANAAALGVDRLTVVEGRAPAILEGHARPNAVFIGGGLSETLLESVFATLSTGTRLVANAVTLESEALLTRWQGLKGGTLLRIELSDAVPIGSRRGWRARYPVVQWSVCL